MHIKGMTAQRMPEIDFLNGGRVWLRGARGLREIEQNMGPTDPMAPRRSTTVAPSMDFVPASDAILPKAASCPHKPWYIFVLLGAVGGGLLVGGGFLIRDYRKKGRS